MRRVARCLALFLVASTGCFSEEPTPEPWVDPGESEQFYDPATIETIELTMSQAALAALAAQPRTYVEATITYRGGTFGPVGVHLKGQNSFQPIDGKPSLRVKIDAYVPDATFYGLADLTLNNMISDPSMMHERLAYQVARDAGLPASRANHVLVTINGAAYGLYTSVETVKKRMIRGWFDDEDGPLYKATDVDFAPQYVGDYELEAGDDDRTLLDGLAEALTIADPEAALAAASAYVDLEHFRRFWAMESVIGQFDAFPYSIPGDDYYLYADPTSGKLWFLPTGMDETFFAADFSPMQTSSVLAARCQAVPACNQAYVDETWTLQAMTEDLGLEALRAQVEAQIAPYVDADPRKPFDAAGITEGQTQLGYFIRGRRATLGNFLPPAS